MRVRYLQHVPFEGVAAIGEWAADRGHRLEATELFRHQGGGGEIPAFPDPAAFDLLVVMGGPMSVYDDAEYPWLPRERAFIRAAITGGKRVVGICLGAQLIAAALGAEVKRGPHKEIGWYPVELTPAGRRLALFADFPTRFPAFHWHGDMFEIPEGALWAASSAACPHQALVLDGGRVVGLQFHLEETAESVSSLVEHAGHELAGGPTPPRVAGPWVATREEVLSPTAPYAACRGLLFGLLDRIALTP
jgi:GMP synthase-like glutamine amidotransferase